jgi:hypothetical protein
MANEIIKEFEPFGNDYSHLAVGQGIEAEQVQRAAKAQLIKYLPSITKQLQYSWDQRDKEYYEITGFEFNRILIPQVEKNNFFTGIKPSLMEASLDRWPNITTTCHDFKPASFQPDQFDVVEATLFIDILCKSEPIKQENLHDEEGIKLEEELDSKLQRLSDAVHMSIKKNASLGGVLTGEISNPPVAKTSEPFVRNEPSPVCILQGRLLEYKVQKTSF